MDAVGWIISAKVSSRIQTVSEVVQPLTLDGHSQNQKTGDLLHTHEILILLFIINNDNWSNLNWTYNGLHLSFAELDVRTETRS